MKIMAIDKMPDSSFITSLGLVLAALVSGLAVYFSQRGKTGVDAQNVITQGFKGLIESLGEEVERQKAKVEDLERELTTQREEEGALRQAVAKLEAFIRAHGLEPPPRPDTMKKENVHGYEYD
jgi:hypothetical protein